MLATLLLWADITALTFVVGFTLLRLLPVDSLSEPASQPSFPLLVIAGLAVISGISNLLSLAISLGLMASLLLPQPYPSVSVEPHTINGLTIYTPSEGDQCWCDAFPCAPRIDSALEMRGAGLVDGFRLRE